MGTASHKLVVASVAAFLLGGAVGWAVFSRVRLPETTLPFVGSGVRVTYPSPQEGLFAIGPNPGDRPTTAYKSVNLRVYRDRVGCVPYPVEKPIWAFTVGDGVYYAVEE